MSQAGRHSVAWLWGQALASLLLAVLVLSLADTFLVAARGGGGSLLRYWLVTSAAGAWLGLFLSAALAVLLVLARAPSQWLGQRSRWARELGAGAFWGGCFAVVALFLLRFWELENERFHLPVLVPAVCAVGGIGVRLLYAMAPRWLFAGLVGAGTLACLVADAMVLRRLYPTLHNVAGLSALCGAFLVAWRYRPALRALPGVWLAALLAQLIMISDLRAVRSAGLQEGVVQPKWIGFLHRVLDRDRDGYSALFGGGDCDDGDDGVYPGQCELAGNGVDDNCNGLVDGSGIAADRPPTTDKPTTDKPTTDKPTTDRPTTDKPTTDKPTTDKPTTDKPTTEVPTTDRPAPDVYLIVVDALRGDFARLPRASVAPEIDAFARQSLDFARAYTPYPSTFRAMLSMAQGRYWRYVQPGARTLPRRFFEHGYDSQIWIHDERRREDASHRILELSAAAGGFFVVPDNGRKATWTERLVDDAIAELAALPMGPPRFRWIHVLDTHAPRLRGKDGDSELERYRAEIRHVSAQLGRLWAALRASDRGQRAIVILLADHGEELGDHSGAAHGATLFDEAARVPLLIHVPAVPAARFEDPVTLVDLVPTLHHVLGWPHDEQLQGRNLLAALPVQPRVLSEVESIDNYGGLGLPALHMVFDGRYKLVANVTDNLMSLYDLHGDPSETRDIFIDSPELARPLVEALQRWQDQSGCRP